MRVTRGVTAHRKAKELRLRSKGMSMTRRSSLKQARQAMLKALSYSYRDRRTRKRDLRSLWITRINAAAREASLSYSQLVNMLTKSGIVLDRKMLAELAVKQPAAFKAIVTTARNAK